MVDSTGSIQKQQYETPSIEKIGEFETMTQHTGRGSNLDASFPTGTPFSSLTFS